MDIEYGLRELAGMMAPAALGLSVGFLAGKFIKPSEKIFVTIGSSALFGAIIFGLAQANILDLFWTKVAVSIDVGTAIGLLASGFPKK